MTELIFVSGAAGKTGHAVLRALKRNGMFVRALARRAEQIQGLRALGADEIVLGDMMSAHDMRLAVTGTAAIYHIPPNMHPDELTIGNHLIQAARQAGVRRLVYHSVLHPQTQKMPHHWNKLMVEEALIESGLHYTVLQPAVYMQNLLAGWQSISQEGLYPVPYPPETRLSLVDLEDVAEAAAVVLSSESYSFGTYELAGTEPLSQNMIAGILSSTLGRKVRVEQIPLEIWQQQARQGSVLSPYAIDTLSAMFRYYAAYGLEGSPLVLAAILGSQPATLAEFLRRQAKRGPA